MRFTVEVPVYLRVDVDAPDAETAAEMGTDFVERAQSNPSTMRLAVRQGAYFSAGIVPLAEDQDRSPDVYVCRGGRLSYVDPDGFLEQLGEACSGP